MRKSVKRKIALMLVLALSAFSFSACGNKGSGESDKKGSGDSKTIKIGGIGPLTGGAAVYGNAVKNGAELAVNEINAAGGINGAKIDFRMEDDENDAEKSVNAYNTLKDWGMQILAGTVTTTPCIAVTEKTKKDNMFQLTPSASAIDVIKNDNSFQVCFTDPNQGSASADYIADKKLAKKVAVIYNSSDSYSAGIYNSFNTQAKAKGLEVVAAEAFTNDSNTDFSAQLSKAKSAGAELVFLPIYAAEASSILKQAKGMSYDAKFFGCDGLDGILGIKGFDQTLADGVMLLTPFTKNGTDKVTKTFVDAFKKAGYEDSTLNQFAADAYDLIYIIKAAMEKASVTPDKSVSDICNALKGAMTEIKVDGTTGAGMSWKATGEVNKQPKAIKIQSGEYIPLD